MKSVSIRSRKVLRVFSFAAVILTCVPPPPALALDATATGIAVPQYDAAGNLVRRLKARSGSGWVDKKTELKEGTVEFFAGEKDLFALVATLEFADGTYDPLSGLIVGDGHMTLHSARGDLAGDGFQYDLARNHLRLKSGVTFDLHGVQVEGGEGEADLAQGPMKDAALILRATVRKGVVVSADPTAKLDFDRAKTEMAIYTAIDETVVLASPVETSRKGQKTVTEAESIRFHIGKDSKSPLAPVTKPAAPATSP